MLFRSTPNKIEVTNWHDFIGLEGYTLRWAVECDGKTVLVYIRDYVDARRNLGEFFIPVAFVMLLGSILVTTIAPQLSVPMMILLYVYLIAVIIDVAVMWRKLKKKLIEKYGEASVAKGSRSASYAWSRAIQVRRWRLPKPRSPKRGNWPK